MSRRLQPCPSCAQHLRAGETRCPFCDAPLPASFGATTSARAASDAIVRPMSRAALLFVGATVAACGGRTQASSASDGGADAAPNKGGGDDWDWDGRTAARAPVQSGGAVRDSGSSGEASSDASIDAPPDATESESAPFSWDQLAPSDAPPMPVSNYGPAAIDNTVTDNPPSAAQMYGPAVIDNGMPVAHYGSAVISGPESTGTK